MALRKFKYLNVIRETENERDIARLLENGYEEIEQEENTQEENTQEENKPVTANKQKRQNRGE